jgi:para-aminobenzoate synthetase component I
LNRRTYNIDDVVVVKQKMLNWASRFNIFSFLDSCSYNNHPRRYDCIVGAGVREQANDMETVQRLIAEKRWLFGHLSYEYNHHLHKLPVRHDRIGFPQISFFEPEIICILNGNELEILADHPQQVFDDIQSEVITTGTVERLTLKQRLHRQEYIEIIRALQAHIQKGDCYEINFCQEFFAEDVSLDMTAAFIKLVEVSPNPFSALYRLNDKVLLCASPERFLFKQDQHLTSQPIKGTIRRELNDRIADQQLRDQLLSSAKDRSENVMVVDLVRNDLSMVCNEDSVKVQELFGIYSFPQVHQMISTISGETHVGFSGIMQALFPMGSMTGAPKHRVMQLIHQYEQQARGIFSGTVGYINPGGDFDFNVVIRSMMYNQSTKYLSCQVGSGITIYSDPEKEWDECLLKAEAIKKVLESKPALL